MQILFRIECVLILLAVAGVAPSFQAPLNLMDDAALRDSFLQRCRDAQNRLYPELLPEKKDCSLLWSTFRARAIDTCPTGPESFKELMVLADHLIPADKAFFWSGVGSNLGSLIKLPGYYFMEKSLMGYTLNSLKNCATKCSTRGGKPCDTFEHFWTAASQWFATRAVGRASVILNASLETPFRETSTFGQFELPLIVSATRVTSMDIYLVNSLNDLQARNACNNPSVQKLQALLRAEGMPVKCTENPDFLMCILCADNPDALRCRLSRGALPGDAVDDAIDADD